ncbi:uncharacterized protein LOC132041462 [Lycium ferocissimum]|uniref:uncharacterized protein LOC132041462 n=1 Tax=Lycium ferocissimum TaxID=112874 RepID=UPI002814DDA3|nr:uncharacterized protein LOC132041462 [Lycium ferocissimum]
MSKSSTRSRKNYESEMRPSRERYRSYSHSDKSSFKLEKSRVGPSHFSSRGDKWAERPSNSRGLSFRSDAGSLASNKDVPRISGYNFNINTSNLVSAIGRITEARWPRPLRSDPGQQESNVVCEYHETYGHKTEDCHQLREEVALLLKNGHLREFLSERAKNHYKERESHKRSEPVEPQHVINMIIGGIDASRGPVMKRTKVSIVREKRTWDCVTEGSISFSDEDAEGIIQPHNDALVISILIFKSQVKRVLIDPGSSANIIRWRVVEQLRLLDQILPVAREISEFNMAREITKGEISLPVNIDGTIQQTVFYVIEGDMKYNALLGRPWIHSIRAIPSILHQLLKFPTPEGIKTIRGEQPAKKGNVRGQGSTPFSKKAGSKR